MDFPYGKAPLAILLLAIISGAGLLFATGTLSGNRPPDLVYATFVKEHALAYAPAVARFEKEYGVKIQLQVVDQKALQSRLQSALQVGADVPDMVELMYGTMGYFTKGPIEDVQLVDLTDRLKQSGMYDKLVTNRFSKWSSRGRIFALPHDVHPVMLAYRRDLVEQLGIDVKKLTTWEEFSRVGRQITSPPDRFMIDLPSDGNDILILLIQQNGGGLFDAAGNVVFDSDAALDVVCWYVRQTTGKTRIAFPAGQGQLFSKAMLDGLVLFYMCPDWRTLQFQNDVPSLSGKLALMPLPAWHEGGIRTSTWGGAGLAFTNKCRNVDLAWKLAMYLYYDPEQLGPEFADTNILPPLKSAWKLPQFHQPSAFFSGVSLGEVYSQLADQVPQEHDTAFNALAKAKLSEAYGDAAAYYDKNGDGGLREYAKSRLAADAEFVRKVIARNVFLNVPTTQTASSSSQ
jgi:arabinosaccharide transport system substrate-binding protein